MKKPSKYRSELMKQVHLNADEVNKLTDTHIYQAIHEERAPTPKWMQDLAAGCNRTPLRVFEDALDYRFSFKFQIDKLQQRSRPAQRARTAEEA